LIEPFSIKEREGGGYKGVLKRGGVVLRKILIMTKENSLIFLFDGGMEHGKPVALSHVIHVRI